MTPKSNNMKHLLFLAVLAFFIAACSNKSAGTDASKTDAVANKTVTLAVEGMSCTGCENTIQEAVGKIGGVTVIKASYTDSTAWVSFDTMQTNLISISEAITDAGYIVKGEKVTANPAGVK